MSPPPAPCPAAAPAAAALLHTSPAGPAAMALAARGAQWSGTRRALPVLGCVALLSLRLLICPGFCPSPSLPPSWPFLLSPPLRAPRGRQAQGQDERRLRTPRHLERAGRVRRRRWACQGTAGSERPARPAGLQVPGSPARGRACRLRPRRRRGAVAGGGRFKLGGGHGAERRGPAPGRL